MFSFKVKESELKPGWVAGGSVPFCATFLFHGTLKHKVGGVDWN